MFLSLFHSHQSPYLTLKLLKFIGGISLIARGTILQNSIDELVGGIAIDGALVKNAGGGGHTGQGIDFDDIGFYVVVKNFDECIYFRA